MKNKLCLLFVSAGLALGLAAPAQANTVSPTALDFGSFAANAVPTTLLSVNVTSGGTSPYFAGVKLTAGKPNFFPSSDCMEARKNFDPCHVFVHMEPELSGTGPLTGTVTVEFTNDGSLEFPPITETQTIALTANVTPALSTPPVVPPTATPGSTTTTPAPVKQQPKRPCKKGQRSTKSKPCTKAKAKGKKGHKRGGKGK
jgi:hypothetical protein